MKALNLLFCLSIGLIICQACKERPESPDQGRLGSLIAQYQSEVASLQQRRAALSKDIDSLFADLKLAEEELAWQDSMTRNGPWKQPKWKLIQTKSF